MTDVELYPYILNDNQKSLIITMYSSLQYVYGRSLSCKAMKLIFNRGRYSEDDKKLLNFLRQEYLDELKNKSL